jgi:hypothetical protein
MRSIRLLALSVGLFAAVSLGGCADLASVASSVAVSVTTATPTQVTTLAEAEQAATLAEQGLDLYVTTGTPSPAVVAELKVLVPALHTVLKQAEAANAAGNSALAAAAIASFNQALAALNSYKTLQGVN